MGIKIYGDGDIYIDGVSRGKIYDDGDIYMDHKLVGKIHDDGEIWLNYKKVGRVYVNGDVWIDGKCVARKCVFLNRDEGNTTPPEKVYNERENKTGKEKGFEGNQSDGSGSNSAGKLSAMGGTGVGGCVTIFIIGFLVLAAIYVSFRVWTVDANDMMSFFETDIMDKLSMILMYIGMFSALYLHWDKGTRTGHASFGYGILLQTIVLSVIYYICAIVDTMLIYQEYGDSLIQVFINANLEYLASIIQLVTIGFMLGIAPAIVGSLVIVLWVKKKGTREGVPKSKIDIKKMIPNTKGKTAKPKTNNYNTTKKVETKTNGYRERKTVRPNVDYSTQGKQEKKPLENSNIHICSGANIFLCFFLGVLVLVERNQNVVVPIIWIIATYVLHKNCKDYKGIWPVIVSMCVCMVCARSQILLANSMGAEFETNAMLHLVCAILYLVGVKGVYDEMKKRNMSIGIAIAVALVWCWHALPLLAYLGIFMQ